MCGTIRREECREDEYSISDNNVISGGCNRDNNESRRTSISEPAGEQILYLDEYEGDLGRRTTLKLTEGNNQWQ